MSGGWGGGHLLGSRPPSLCVPTKSLIMHSCIISTITLNMLICNELCVGVLTQSSLKAGVLSSPALGSLQEASAE